MDPDILIVRHNMSGVPYLLSEKVNCSVINAGDGSNEHPTQALLDALTIKRHKKRGVNKKQVALNPCAASVPSSESASSGTKAPMRVLVCPPERAQGSSLSSAKRSEYFMEYFCGSSRRSLLSRAPQAPEIKTFEVTRTRHTEPSQPSRPNSISLIHLSSFLALIFFSGIYT